MMTMLNCSLVLICDDCESEVHIESNYKHAFFDFRTPKISPKTRYTYPKVCTHAEMILFMHFLKMNLNYYH